MDDVQRLMTPDFINSVVDEAIAVQQIAAPTFSEKKRSEYVYHRFPDIGLTDIEIDGLYNTIGCLKGSSSDKVVLVSAHTDTVFESEVDLTIKRESNRVYGPGIGDNSLGVAALLALPQMLEKMSITLPFDIYLVANSCEEGIGDLLGMKNVIRHFEREIDAVIVLEGFGVRDICYCGIGSKRFQIDVSGEGGHSWGDYGQTSAVHVLVQIAEKITGIKVPTTPRSSINIGVIEGGTSVNTIADSAKMLVDFRSESSDALKDLVGQFEQIVEQQPSGDTDIRIEKIGDRSAGGLNSDHWLVKTCFSTMKELGLPEPEAISMSSDANVPLSLGIPAVCIGLTDGKNVHRLNEYMEIAPIKDGLSRMIQLIINITTLLS